MVPQPLHRLSSNVAAIKTPVRGIDLSPAKLRSKLFPNRIPRLDVLVNMKLKFNVLVLSTRILLTVAFD
jgi:hypothetical protein